MPATANLKIGLVLDDTLDSTDGVQQYVLALGAWLGSQGHEVHYLVGQTERRDLSAVHSLSRNIKVRFNGNRLSVPLPAGRAAIHELLQRERFDVLHVQMPYSPFMAGRVIRAAPAATAVIGTFHILPHSSFVRTANQLLAAVVRRSLRRFDRVVAVSDAAAEFAQQTYGLRADVLPNVVDVARFQSATPRPQLRQRQPVILFLGRLVPRKGCMTLLRAVRRLCESAEPFSGSVVICGKGPLEADLKEYALRNGLADTVTFAGYVSEADKPAYLASADIAVYPSTGGESFGIVLTEAMASGRPVVLGADNPGYHSVLQGYPELLFEPDDDTVLADTLRHFLADTDAASRAVDWQRQHVRQFDTDTVGHKLLAVYAQALRPGR